MAGSSKSRSTGSASRSSSKKSSSKSSARSTSNKRTVRSNPAPVENESGFSVAFKKFASSKAATPLIFLASVILIVGIDLLVSWNKFEMFFKILGVELLIAVAVWIVMTLVFSRRTTKDSDTVEDEV